MGNEVVFERLSEIQDEILGFTWEQVGDKVDKFYVQGKVGDDENGNITFYSGDLNYAVVGGKVLNNSDVLTDEEFDENSDYISPRIVELHDLLFGLQGKSPVRFRWGLDTRSGEVESEWTYYDDLSDEEKEDDFWMGGLADFAWRDRLQAELDEQMKQS